MKDYIEERAINIANFIIDSSATVRQTAKQFGISKSKQVYGAYSGNKTERFKSKMIWTIN